MSLNTKFVLSIFLSGFFVFTFSTMLEVYLGYQAEREKIDENIHVIERNYLKPLVLSLFTYNQEQITLLVEAIQRLDGIASCTIIEGKTPEPPRDRKSHGYDLVYTYPSGKKLYLGRLEVEINYNEIKQKVWSWLSVRLISLFIALCLLAAVVTILFQRLIASRLSRIADFASEINVMRINTRFPLDQLSSKDELGKVVEAINEVLDRLESGLIEKEKARRELLAKEEAYRNLVENANDAIYIVQDDKIKFCNRVTETITGYSANELFQISLKDLIHPEDRELIADRIRRRFNREQLSTTVSCRFLHKNGKARFAEINSVLIEWEKRPAILSFLRDLTEEKNLKDQLIQSQKMDSIGRLAGGVAHDLNNLLTPILGYAELLNQNILSGEKQESAFEQILNAGKRARDLVRQLLAFSRKQNFEFQPIDINTVISGLKELLQRTVRENIQIIINKGSGLPLILGDVSQLEQVVMNLIVNASDAMPDGGKIFIETSMIEIDEKFVSTHLTAQPGTYLQLSVSDTGIGMDPETCDKIYEPFFTTKGDLGTGLGLSTVYGIVKQHGGVISVYSELGKGTRFHIYLPAADREIMQPSATDAPSAKLVGRETILLAEDNEQVRTVTRDLLQSLGYTVLPAQSGEQAVEIFKTSRKKIDLLLTDIIMPKMNGRELYETLKKCSEGLKVVYMSGYTSDVIIHHGVVAEGVHFIQKPFTSTSLATKIRKVLDG